MSDAEQAEFPFEFPAERPKSALPLVFIGSTNQPLSVAQKEFNRLIQRLNKVRAEQE